MPSEFVKYWRENGDSSINFVRNGSSFVKICMGFAKKENSYPCSEQRREASESGINH